MRCDGLRSVRIGDSIRERSRRERHLAPVPRSVDVEQVDSHELELNLGREIACDGAHLCNGFGRHAVERRPRGVRLVGPETVVEPGEAVIFVDAEDSAPVVGVALRVDPRDGACEAGTVSVQLAMGRSQETVERLRAGDCWVGDVGSAGSG